MAEELKKGFGGAADGTGGGVPELSTLPEPARVIVENAYGVATADVFLIGAPFAFLALIAVIFIKEKPLRTQSGMERLAEETAAAQPAATHALILIPAPGPVHGGRAPDGFRATPPVMVSR